MLKNFGQFPTELVQWSIWMILLCLPFHVSELILTLIRGNCLVFQVLTALTTEACPHHRSLPSQFPGQGVCSFHLFHFTGVSVPMPAIFSSHGHISHTPRGSLTSMILNSTIPKTERVTDKSESSGHTNKYQKVVVIPGMSQGSILTEPGWASGWPGFPFINVEFLLHSLSSHLAGIVRSSILD